jgi:CheY-like chemotaxis protein
MAPDSDAAPAARDTSRVILGTATKWEGPPAGAPAGPLAGRVVVLAEPSRVQAGIIRRYLQQLGAAAVHPAGSGKEAHELARRERADAVVCAMHLGDTTGLQLAHAVLADPACPRTGVVLATSETEADDGAALPDSPRAVLMPKPFDQARLAVAVVAVAPPAGR